MPIQAALAALRLAATPTIRAVPAARRLTTLWAAAAVQGRGWVLERLAAEAAATTQVVAAAADGAATVASEILPLGVPAEGVVAAALA